MEKTNLLFIITKLELGGAQKQLLTLLSRLDKSRYRVFLFTANEGPLINAAAVIPGVALYRSRFLERPINLFKDAAAFVEICLFIRGRGIDLVHTHSSKAGIIGRCAAAACRVKVIVHTVHGWSFHDYQPRFVYQFYVWLERRAAGFTSRLITVSDDDRNKGIRHGIASPDAYALVRHGVPETVQPSARQEVRRELGVGEKDLLVGMVACLKPQKCPEDFIRAAAIVNRRVAASRFVIVGDGVLRPRIERLLRQLGLTSRVILAGWRQDAGQLIQAFDLYLLTSLWEGLPVTVLEAMRAGKPVVATDTGGIAEAVVDGETGFLVRPHQPGEAAERLIRLLEDPGLRLRMGESGRRALQGMYTEQELVVATEAVYSHLG